LRNNCTNIALQAVCKQVAINPLYVQTNLASYPPVHWKSMVDEILQSADVHQSDSCNKLQCCIIL